MPPLPTTAAELADAAERFGPTVKGADLTLTTKSPAAIYGLLTVLHTGVRALLTGRRWIGCGSTVQHAAPRVLSPRLPIPLGITLLCVEGDTTSWNRFPETARDAFPELFERPKEATAKAG